MTVSRILIVCTVFLWIEVRRYRIYDIWRSRVRLLEENVFANALEPEGVEQSNWRKLLSDDLRQPTLKTSAQEAVARRLRRVYFPLISVLVGAWLVRLTVFGSSSTGLTESATVGAIAGEVVLLVTGLFYGTVLMITVWPSRRHAKGELRSEADSEDWK